MQEMKHFLAPDENIVHVSISNCTRGILKVVKLVLVHDPKRTAGEKSAQ